jgi:ornithine carbamoyltransferase
MAADFIALTDFTGREIESLMDAAEALRAAWRQGQMPRTLRGRNVALVWDAGGFRNRVAFELGIASMGGRAVQVPGKLDAREPIEDVARYLQNWFHAIVARTETHAHMLRLAAAATIPVINARTDFNHPCEILGDLTYVRAERGSLEGLKVVFVGEPTNLCHPWFEAAARLPITVIQACPEGFGTDPSWLEGLRVDAVGSLQVSHDLSESLRGADVVYTDCWPRRGTAEEGERIRALFLPYQVTEERLRIAGPRCFFLPCPPVTRGEEVSAGAMDRCARHVYAAKEYLLHAQNAVLSMLLPPRSGEEGRGDGA